MRVTQPASRLKHNITHTHTFIINSAASHYLTNLAIIYLTTKVKSSGIVRRQSECRILK